MIFISAGHNSKSKTIKVDPGAINKFGVKEGDLTIEFVDLVCNHLDFFGIKYIRDKTEENLQQYVNRINTGDGSVVCEYHFDAGPETATGTTTLIEIDGDRLDLAMAKELSAVTASILGIKNRGVLTEAQTRHKRLALMSEQGIVALHELCFLTNEKDMAAYTLKKNELAKAHAEILIKYEKIIP